MDKHRILVIGMDIGFHLRLVRQLGSEYQVDRRECYVADDEPCEVVILDYSFPDAYEIIQAIKLSPTNPPDVILLIDRSDETTANTLSGWGYVYNYLRKPIADFGLVAMLIQEILEKQDLAATTEELS